MPKRPCLGYRGQTCRVLTTGTRCPTHARMYEQTRRPVPSARARGYTAEYERNRRAVLAASRVCWLCGHDGADQTDDVVPKSKGGDSAVTNLRPAHGTRPCPTCGKRCNQARGNRDVTPSTTPAVDAQALDDARSDAGQPGTRVAGQAPMAYPTHARSRT